VRVSVGRREPLLVADETLIDLTDSAVPAFVDPGLVADPMPVRDSGAPPGDPDADPVGAPQQENEASS